MVAPAPLMLGLNKDPETGKPAFVFTGQQATLGNPYFGSGCRTGISGEPEAEETGLKYVRPSLFRRKSFSIKLAGSTREDGIAYRWTTVFRFKRQR